MRTGFCASFKLFLRCSDCLANDTLRLDIPDADDAPQSVDELVESAMLGAVRFGCRKCDSPIAEIIGINQIETRIAA